MKPLFSRRAYVIAQLSGWSVYALLNFALIANGSNSTAVAFASAVMLSGLGFLASHALRAVAKRREWDQSSWPALVLRVLLSSAVLASLVQAAQLVFVVAVLGVFTWDQVQVAAFVVYVVQLSILLLLWQGLYFGAHAIARVRRAELDRLEGVAATQTAELRALRSQLNPHFLFNSLNTVRALIVEDPPRAQEAVTRLSSLLRYALAAGEAQTVSLESELEVVKDYLALEVLRFEERLQVRLEVPSTCLRVPVPVMLLQTLVENAVKHGIARCPAGGEVSIVARKEDGVLWVEVMNPSPQTPARVESTGVGLANTRERLRLMFGERAHFELQTAGASTVAKVRLPCP